MTIETELLALKKSDGTIVAEDGVAWARKHPKSALHRSLEWNNNKAAHEYRIWQVRRLIAIHIISETGIRQVVSLSIDRSKDRGGYRSLDDVMPNKMLRAVLLQDALNELDRVQQKYERLQELDQVWSEKDKIKTRRKAA